MIRILCLALALAGAANAQSIPRTPDGRPDFQGVWENQFWTRLERPADASGVVISRAEGERLLEEEAKARIARASLNATYGHIPPRVWAMVRGEYRSSMITEPPDGRLPLTPRGRNLRPAPSPSSSPQNRPAPPSTNNPEERSPPERCLSTIGMAPMLVASENNLRRFVQTPGFLMIHTEESSHARIVALGGPASSEPIRSRDGRSIGRWQGDTLVVETTHIENKSPLRSGAIPIGPGSRVIERFSFAAPDELFYQFTVEDPEFYAAPWSAEYVMKRSNERMFEFACHEGNYALANMLSGARMEERNAARTKGGKP